MGVAADATINVSLAHLARLLPLPLGYRLASSPEGVLRFDVVFAEGPVGAVSPIRLSAVYVVDASGALTLTHLAPL